MVVNTAKTATATKTLTRFVRDTLFVIVRILLRRKRPGARRRARPRGSPPRTSTFSLTLFDRLNRILGGMFAGQVTEGEGGTKGAAAAPVGRSGGRRNAVACTVQPCDRLVIYVENARILIDHRTTVRVQRACT